MPRAELSVTTFTRAGVALVATTGDPVNNHTIVNDGRTGVIVENTGSTVSRTVTFHIRQTVDGFAVAPRTETLAVGESQGFGPFDPNEYGSRLLIDVDNAELKLTPIRIG
jgi:hypothetical protein